MKVTDRAYALELDKNDPLAHYRSKFVITDPNLCYLDGNSLGRLPHATVKAVSDFLSQEWGNEVVTGWSHWIDEAQVAGDLLLVVPHRPNDSTLLQLRGPTLESYIHLLQ